MSTRVKDYSIHIHGGNITFGADVTADQQARGCAVAKIIERRIGDELERYHQHILFGDPLPVEPCSQDDYEKLRDELRAAREKCRRLTAVAEEYCAERDQAIRERDRAMAEQDELIAQRDVAVLARDCALNGQILAPLDPESPADLRRAADLIDGLNEKHENGGWTAWSAHDLLTEADQEEADTAAEDARVEKVAKALYERYFTEVAWENVVNNQIRGRFLVDARAAIAAMEADQ